MTLSHSKKTNALAFAALVVAGLSLAACNTSQVSTAPKASLSAPEEKTERLPEPTLSNGVTSGAEAFSSREYGVAASPLVATGTKLKRGGGYQMVGKPYTIKGITYTPTERQKPLQTGRASWYGKAFHGRLTANGEVFDMNHLTGAHKTMPLPSYARVTNKKNGKSVIVRVNDRGPFSKSRIIDVSKRAAEVLDFVNAGTADVAVEYVGPAPLHGNDDEYLLSSARGLSREAEVQLASAAPSPELPGVRDAQDIPVTTVSFDETPPMPQPALRPAVDSLASQVSAYAEFRIEQAFAPSGSNPRWKTR